MYVCKCPLLCSHVCVCSREPLCVCVCVCMAVGAGRCVCVCVCVWGILCERERERELCLQRRSPLKAALTAVTANVCRHPQHFSLNSCTFPRRWFEMCFVCNLQFYCITEEVMLAEENKNSGRSPLDGKFTHIRNHIFYTSTSTNTAKTALLEIS